MDVIALAVNVMLILESEESIFLDVIALTVNVMLIFESEETIFLRQQFLDVIALAVNVIIVWDFRKWKNNIFIVNVFPRSFEAYLLRIKKSHFFCFQTK